VSSEGLIIMETTIIFAQQVCKTDKPDINGVYRYLILGYERINLKQAELTYVVESEYGKFRFLNAVELPMIRITEKQYNNYIAIGMRENLFTGQA
jgi:hypothetical protein